MNRTPRLAIVSLLLFPLVLALWLAASPVAALDVIFLVRHAEKADDWPAARDLDAFRPLAPAGAARAEALAVRLKGEGIAAIYSSRTSRTLATGEPLAKATGRPLMADDASTRPAEMDGFLTALRQKHSADRAVLIVGHANTIPELLVRLGAKPDCFQHLGITGQPGSLMTETYDGLWRVDLKKQGCEAIEREMLAAGK
ncbi:MAG TPA: phosphoglycerate mutase family protein [Thermoanaerobaculia bacterium]|jgi:broad specificity phosphatase PhoE|nr:phosphoglycerate mutase family protein [Thermoanaerobaculia bacterium]